MGSVHRMSTRLNPMFKPHFVPVVINDGNTDSVVLIQ